MGEVPLYCKEVEKLNKLAVESETEDVWEEYHLTTILLPRFRAKVVKATKLAKNINAAEIVHRARGQG